MSSFKKLTNLWSNWLKDTRLILLHSRQYLIYEIEASKPKWVNPVLNIIVVNSLRLEGLQLSLKLLFHVIFHQFFLNKPLNTHSGYGGGTLNLRLNNLSGYQSTFSWVSFPNILRDAALILASTSLSPSKSGSNSLVLFSDDNCWRKNYTLYN